METNNVQEVLDEILASCKMYDLQGVFILSQKIEDGRGTACLIYGNMARIIMDIMRTMNTNPQVASIFKIAVENHSSLKHFEETKKTGIDISELIKGISQN